MSKVTIVDSPMGAGKTSSAINMINDLSKNTIRPHIMYITPYLDEIERVKQSVDIELIDPSISYNSKTDRQSKLNGFKKLIEDNCDIISTHALFKNIDTEVLELLESRNYILILDEVFQVIENIKIKRNDLRLLIDNEWIIPVEGDNRGRYKWNDSVAPSGGTSFEYIKHFSDTKNLYVFNDIALYWTFPVEVFKHFEETFILTYLFDAQIQSYYYKLYDIEYVKKSAKIVDGKYIITDYDKDQDMKFRSELKDLLNVYDGKLNENYIAKNTNKGKLKFLLSSNWYKNKSNDKYINMMKNNLNNYFCHITNANKDNRLWTCYKEQMDILKGRKYNRQFLSYTTRATNDYKHVENMAFLINVFMNPNEENYFTYQDVKVNGDLKAISDLLQWVYRGCIRDGKPMNLYLPSERMRILLSDFIEGKL